MTEPARRPCRECGRSSTEFDFYYGEVVPGYDCIGRIYVCRECWGEEVWHDLAQVPELAPGLFVGRSTRIAQERDPSA